MLGINLLEQKPRFPPTTLEDRMKQGRYLGSWVGTLAAVALVVEPASNMAASLVEELAMTDPLQRAGTYVSTIGVYALAIAGIGWAAGYLGGMLLGRAAHPLIEKGKNLAGLIVDLYRGERYEPK